MQLDPQDFDIKKELGRGGMAVVYEAVYKPNGRKFAIKTIEKGFMVDHDWTNLQREATIMMSLNHENVLRLYHVFESDEHYHLVLDFMPGGELFEHIVHRGRFTERDAQNVVRQILSGVAYLHQNGIAHRDLKPENLLCDEHERVVISDFGLSKFFGRGELLTTRCGTPGYIAPEVLKADIYTPAVDLWTIGVITYVLLSGIPPFYGDDEQVTNAILNADFDFPDTHFAHISDEAKNFIESLFVMEPAKRPTAEQALKHPWLLADLSNSTDEVSFDIRQSVESYVERRRNSNRGM